MASRAWLVTTMCDLVAASRAFSAKHREPNGQRWAPMHSCALTETWRQAASGTPGTSSSRSPVVVSSAHSCRRLTWRPSGEAGPVSAWSNRPSCGRRRGRRAGGAGTGSCGGPSGWRRTARCRAAAPARWPGAAGHGRSAGAAGRWWRWRPPPCCGNSSRSGWPGPGRPAISRCRSRPGQPGARRCRWRARRLRPWRPGRAVPRRRCPPRPRPGARRPRGGRPERARARNRGRFRFQGKHGPGGRRHGRTVPRTDWQRRLGCAGRQVGAACPRSGRRHPGPRVAGRRTAGHRRPFG